MGKVKTFEIGFTSQTSQTCQSCVYFSGQVIQGYVTLHLQEELKMRGIRLHFAGVANVRWSSGSGKHRRTYYSRETYIDHVVVLFGKAPGGEGDNPVHPAGVFTYPFQVAIPPNVPSSYQAAFGRVTYIMKAVIDKPWAFDENSNPVEIRVLNILDLNMEQSANMPQQAQDSKTLCCCCCASPPIEATFRINRTGYVPGDIVTIFAEISNGSDRKVNSTSVRLIKRTIFYATNQKRVVNVDIDGTYLRHGPINKKSSDSWSGEQLRIPLLPPSRLDGCSIMDVKYMLVLNVAPSGGIDMEIPLEIIIGSVPLIPSGQSLAPGTPNYGFILQQYAQLLPMPMPDMDQSEAGGSYVYPEPSAPSEYDPNYPPPTYNSW